MLKCFVCHHVCHGNRTCFIFPTEELKNICEISDRIFDFFHGDGLRFCKNPFSDLCKEILDENPTLSVKVVSLYCRVKFYARLRQLNRDIKIKNLNKSVRTFKQNAQFSN